MTTSGRPIRGLVNLMTLLLCIALVACSGEGSGGEASVLLPEQGVIDGEPQTFIINNADGGAALQQALDTARTGDTIIIRAGSENYQSEYRFPGETLRGFTLVNSGTAEAPIRIIGEAAGGVARPVIDQGKIAAHDPDAPGATPEATVGLYLLCASHVVIDNLEIRNVHLAGITTSLSACDSRDIRIENSHIHHVYGDRDVGAIRLSRASDITVYNNDLHDIYQTDSERQVPLFTGNHHQIDNIRIEHNRFTAMHTGVRLQAQHDKSIAEVVISSNHFEGLDVAITGQVNALDAMTPANGRLTSITVKDNLFMEGRRGVLADGGDSLSQSGNLAIYNNTFYDFSETLLRFSGFDAVAVYNNIFSHITRNLLISAAPVNAALSNEISEYDYNLYWHPDYSAATGPEWLLDLGGANQHIFASADDWQRAYSDTLHPQLLADPDLASQFADPQFNDAVSGDFSPGLPFVLGGGRNGEALGAFRDGQRPGLE